MGGASYVQTSFLGGEISQMAQGRFDKPEYRSSMNVCRNSFPVEIGAWTRRPGTQYAGHTRGGAEGRVIKFDFEQAQPYTIEITAGYLRFRSGATLAGTNDNQAVVGVSTANPAVVELTNAVDWATGDTLMFPSPGPAPLLENRQFTATKVDTTHFQLADALTGANIDGSTLGAITAGTIVYRVQEVATDYLSDRWRSVRAVQAETLSGPVSVLLQSSIKPQALTADVLPTDTTDAQFSVDDIVFVDGPYLDPFRGSVITPDATFGLINFTLSFQAYSATRAYSKGDYVQDSGVGYKSLLNANLGHTPGSSPTYWEAVGVGDPVGPNGFVDTDVGRHIRFYNNTAGPVWSNATTYNIDDIVTVTTGSVSVGYKSLVANNLNHAPASSPLYWTVFSPGWTNGIITAMSTTGLINPSAGTNIGNMTSYGGLAAAFDGVTGKVYTNCAAVATIVSGYVTNYAQIGKNFTGSPQSVSSVVVYPSSDKGFALQVGGSGSAFTINLRAKATAPASPSDGTLLGSIALAANQTTPVTISSNDAATTWNYMWVEIVFPTVSVYPGNAVNMQVSQVQFYTSAGTPGTIAQVQLLGNQLPNTGPITTWRLGVYSDTSGWPTCGCFHEGRIWLAGAVPNRWDASVSNGLDGSRLDFSPTAQSGAVADNNAISYTLNSDGVNPIYWLQPDLQGVIIGTQAGEWLVQAPTNGPITPTNVAARRVTKIGAANVDPCRTDNTNIFAQRYRIRLMEYFADVRSGKFSGPNLAEKAEHITRNKLAELAYVSSSTPMIWARCDDGSLFGVTYKRDALTTAQEAIAGFHPHALGSDRTIESLCAGPSVGGELDTITMVTNDADTNIRHVELLTDSPDELAALEDAWFLDSGVAPSSTSSTSAELDGAPYGGMTINGLWHLNGKTVQVFAGGLDCGNRGTGSTGYTDFAVTNGSCFVPYGDGVSAGSGNGLFTEDFVNSFSDGIPIVVGFTYDSEGQLIRPNAMAETGARNGPGFGKTRRNHRYAIQCVNARGVEIGTAFDDLLPVSFAQADEQTPIGTLAMFSGIHADTINDDYSHDGMICWRVSRPYPASITVVGGNIMTQDE
jgi:hypothetical protein